MTLPAATPKTADAPALLWMRQALDELDHGIIVLTDGELVHANRVALALLNQPDSPLHRRGRSIVATTREGTEQLATALRGAQRGNRQMLKLGTSNWSMAIALIPLIQVTVQDQAGTVLAIMGKQRVCGPLAAHWFCRLHSLTPAESKVLSDLLLGHLPRAIAERNGVAMSTVRTQIASILDKTASRGIHQLLLSAATLPPVVPVVVTADMPMAA